MTLGKYYDNRGRDIYQEDILGGRIIFIEDTREGLCIELTDTSGNSVNIGAYVDITLDTPIEDIKYIVLRYLFDNYLYNHN